MDTIMWKRYLKIKYRNEDIEITRIIQPWKNVVKRHGIPRNRT